MSVDRLMKRALRLIVGAAAALPLLPASIAAAAPGDLDPGFGSHGISSTPGLGAATPLPDGKILVVGNGSIRRLNPDGSVDGDFGERPSGFCDRDLAVQSDGGILATGTGYGAFPYFPRVCRFLSNGSPDSGFGDGGEVRIDIGSNYGAAYSVAVENSGRILVGGMLGGRATVFGLQADGSIDPGFGENGVIDFGRGDVSAIESDESGRWYAAGSYAGMSVSRFADDGALDMTYGDGGTRSLPGGTIDGGGVLLSVTDDGRAALASTLSTYAIHGVYINSSLGVVDPAGNVDAGFDTAPTQHIAVIGQQIYSGLTWDTRGNLLVSGTQLFQSYPRATATAYIARLLPNGALDPSFAEDGVGFFPTDFSTFPGGGIGGLTLQDDGRILGSAALTLVRFLDGGTTADADADGTADAKDSCPRRYSDRADGCQRIPVSVRADYSGGLVSGTVNSVRICIRTETEKRHRDVLRKIRLLRKVPGKDDLIRSTTIRQRQFSFRAKLNDGRFYVSLPQKLRPGVVICGGATDRVGS